MNAFSGLSSPFLIGHFPSPAPTLAAIRAPASLPWSVSAPLFESHWLYWIAALAIGTVLLLAGYRRNQRLPILLGRILLILTALWILAATAVVTPAERLAAQHQALYSAAENGDAAAINTVLAPDFHFGPNDRATMETAVAAVLQTIKVKSNFVRGYAAMPQGSDRAISFVHLITNIEPIGALASVPVGGNQYTEWTLFWIDVPNQDWRLQLIIDAKYGTPENLVEIPPTLKP